MYGRTRKMANGENDPYQFFWDRAENHEKFAAEHEFLGNPGRRNLPYKLYGGRGKMANGENGPP